MKRKGWWIFGVIQVVGMSACVDPWYIQDPILWGLSLLLFLPGSLASYTLSTPGHLGTHWPALALGGIAVIANVLLFSTASLFVARLRRPN